MPSNRPRRLHVNYTAHAVKMVKTDDSEDGCIHCIKPDRVAAGAARDVSEGTAKLNAEGLEEDSGDDPFASSDQMEDDETVINYE